MGIGGGVARELWHTSAPKRCIRSGGELAAWGLGTGTDRGWGRAMEANPWAVVCFGGLLFVVDAIGVSVMKTGVLFLLFAGFVPLWLIAGYLWDKATSRSQESED